MKKLISWITPIIFLSLIIGFTVFDILSPNKSFSESENRYLAEMPKLTAENVFNGKFSSGYESYVTDHFIGRDKFIAVKVTADAAMLKKENKNVYIGKDGYLLERLDNEVTDKATLEKNLSRIEEFIRRYENAYFMPIPTAAEVLKAKLPDNAPTIDQTAAVSGLNVNYIDASAELKAHTDENIYYKTDHHWTTLGAYYGYTAICGALNAEPRPISEYETNAVSDEFYGTLYTKAPLPWLNPDTITKFTPKFASEYTVSYNSGEKVTDSPYDEGYLDKRDKYSYFLSSNNALVKIENPYASEPQRRILLIKDSFSNCLAPFLTDTFGEVTLVDLRYYNAGIKKLISENEFTDIIVGYNFATLQSEKKILNITR